MVELVNYHWRELPQVLFLRKVGPISQESRSVDSSLKLMIIITINIMDSSYRAQIVFAKQNLNALTHTIHSQTRRYTHNLRSPEWSAYRFEKMLSKEEHLELGFEPRQSGEISYTGRQQIPDR